MPAPKLLACLVALVIASSLGGGAGAAPGPDASAEAALERALALFDGRAAAHGEATLVLRDLALALDRLSEGQRRQAQALLERPEYRAPTRYVCANVCVHWVESTADAPPLRDANGNAVPDWVDTTLGVLEHIWAKEIVEFGFRPPKSDLDVPDHGPDGRLDVYLQDIADEVLGYCVPELPPTYLEYDISGYCVLDDDYSYAQLGPPGLGGRRELELTAAHEFFHAVQFGYDFAEDGWLMEGTATWIEDEVYDALDEPNGRFPYSPLLHPEVPVDTWSATQPFQYGAWVFWRFLEELFSPDEKPRDPSIIRRVLEFADGRRGAPDLSSLEAVDAVAREHQSNLRSTFAAFGVVNYVPTSFYSEGKEFPKSPLTRSFALTKAKPAIGSQRLVLDHLTNRYVSFAPGAGVGRAARLTVSIDLPEATRGSDASVISFERSGPRVQRLSLDILGQASITVPFGRGTVSRVVLVLTNASGRFVCFQRTRFSCQGRPLDDDLPFLFSARLAG